MLHLLEPGNGNGADFSGKDTADRYQKNLETQAQDWLWRTRPVRYTLNSQSYRAPEWDLCDWDNSILIFGCSLVYGIGVDDTDTLSHQISERTGLPVINLGQGGTGISFALANSIILRENNIKPKAVVYVWPDRSRQTEFLSEHNTISHGPWNLNRSWMAPWATNNEHNLHWASYTIRSLRLMWDCPVIEASWYKDMVDIANCKRLPFNDFARDLEHPGPRSLSLSANIITQGLNYTKY